MWFRYPGRDRLLSNGFRDGVVYITVDGNIRECINYGDVVKLSDINRLRCTNYIDYYLGKMPLIPDPPTHSTSYARHDNAYINPQQLRKQIVSIKSRKYVETGEGGVCIN